MVPIRLALWISVDDIGQCDGAGWPIGRRPIISQDGLGLLSDPGG